MYELYHISNSVDNSLEKARKVRLSNYFSNFINNISIEFRIIITLLQKFLQTEIFFDQFIVSTVTFCKCLAGFMIPIALLKELGE